MSDLISDPPTMKVDVITEQGRAEARVCDLTDAQLENAIGNVAADLALAEKYEHNAHLRPAIRAHFDMLDAERKRRGSSAEPAPPTCKTCGHAAVFHALDIHMEFCEAPDCECEKFVPLPKTAKQRIDAVRRKIDTAKSELEAVAREFIPGYHFLDSSVSTWWECETRPVGYCVFALDHDTGRRTECRYCGDPDERK